MNPTDPSYSNGGSNSTIAATFSNKNAAKAALDDLHDAGFRNVWLGVTHGGTGSAGATIAAEDTGGVMNSLGRFFSGEGTQEQALHQALIAHGLSEDQARRLEATVAADASIVTVRGENDADEAAEILQRNGGILAGGASGSATGAVPATRSDIDETRRLQLREERLLIDKQRVASGEARIRKEVVSEQQSIDVPVYHEELFIQRRPVADGGTASTTPIGQDEEIRIPLSEERVDVSKRTVVTEEVNVAVRKVEGTEHVSGTVRHEELLVDDGSNVDVAQKPIR